MLGSLRQTFVSVRSAEGSVVPGTTDEGIVAVPFSKYLRTALALPQRTIRCVVLEHSNFPALAPEEDPPYPVVWSVKLSH